MSITFGTKSSSLSCDLGLCKGEVAMETFSCGGRKGEVAAEILLFISTWSSEISILRYCKNPNSSDTRNISVIILKL